MTSEQYTERISELLDRYKNAVKANCTLTANARLRDMARVMAEYEGESYAKCLEKVKNTIKNS